MSVLTQTETACPHCEDGTVDSISDCFSGQAKHLDNFDDVEDYLREQGAVSDTDPVIAEMTEEELVEFREYIRDSDRHTIEEAFNREGPFITESIVCNEEWCNSCDYSRRTFHPIRDGTGL